MTALTMPSSTGAAQALSQPVVAQLPAQVSPTLTQQVSAAAALSLQPLRLPPTALSAPRAGPLLKDAQGFVPEVTQKRSSLTGALRLLDAALPSPPAVQAALSRMSPAQKTVVANTALLLLAQHQDGRLNGAEFRRALQDLLNTGDRIQVGTPAGAAGGRSGTPLPLKLPRFAPLPEPNPLALPRRLPSNSTQARGNAATGSGLTPEDRKSIERLIADQAAVVPGFVWPSEPHLSIEAILEAIATATPEQIGAMLRELAHTAPEVYQWLVQQDFFVEAVGRRLDVADLPRALEIPEVLRPQLQRALPLDHEPNGRDLLARMLSLSHQRGELARYTHELPELAPLLDEWLKDRPWFTQLLNWSAGLAPSAQLVLMTRNERGQPVASKALPSYDAGSSLHIGYLGSEGGAQRMFVVPGTNAAVGGSPVPGRLEEGEEPLAALVRTMSGQTRGMRPLRTFAATVTPEGLWRMTGPAQPSDDTMQALADISQRPTLRADGAVAAPATLKQQLKSTGFVFSQGANADRLSEDVRLARAVVRLGQHFDVGALPNLLQSVRSRLPADDTLPEKNMQLAEFMRVMQHDCTPEAHRLAAESLTRKLGLAAPQSDNATRARTLLDEITQYVASPNHTIDSLQRRDSTLDAQLRRNHGPGWLKAAREELEQRSQTDSLLGVIAVYYRELLDFAAPNRR
jgi:hypothetical protein